MNIQTVTSEIVALRGGNVSLLVELCRPVPHVLHWGADLGELSARDIEALRVSSSASSTHNSTDDPRTLTVLPTEADAWSVVARWLCTFCEDTQPAFASEA